MKRSPALLPIAFTTLWLMPLVLMSCLVWRCAIDIPLADDFSTGRTLYKSVTTGIGWPDLVAQHNESRPLFPRLIFDCLGKLSGWDVRWQMAGSLCLVGLTGVAALALAGRTIDDRRVAGAVALLVNLLLFSPVQWKNFLWGIQFIVFVPALSLMLIMLLLGSRWSLRVSLPLAAVAAVVSTYSNSNGLLVWIVPIPFFLLHPSSRRFVATGVWIALATAAIGYYFHGYQNPGDPSLAAVLRQPRNAALFVMAFIGNGVRLDTVVTHAVRCGGAAMVVWAAGVFYVAVIARDKTLWRKALPWITLGIYALASGILAMLGRLVPHGLPGAISERYPTFALALWVSLVPLWAIIFRRRTPRKSGREIAATLTTCSMAGCLLLLTMLGWRFVRNEIRAFNARQLAGRAVAQFSLVVHDDPAIVATLHPVAWVVTGEIVDMDRIDFMHCQCFRSNDISTVAAFTPRGSAGRFESLQISGDQLILTGWACIPRTDHLADAVLLTSPDANGVERIFAIVWQDRIDRHDLQRETHCRDLGRSGWIRRLDRSMLPPGTPISAWAFDTYARRAYRLDGDQRNPHL